MKHTKSRLFVVALLAAGGLLISLASPASALDTVIEPDNAGYFVTSTTPFTEATLRVVIPEFTCPPTGTSAVTLDVELERDIGDDVSVLIGAGCRDGAMTAAATVQLPGAVPADLTVNPGDPVALALMYNGSSGATKLVARDVTTGDIAVLRATIPDLAFRSVLYDVHKDGPLPPFDQIKLSNLKVDGVAIGTRLEDQTRAQMAANGQRLATTSLLLHDGTAFNVKRVEAV